MSTTPYSTATPESAMKPTLVVMRPGVKRREFEFGAFSSSSRPASLA